MSATQKRKKKQYEDSYMISAIAAIRNGMSFNAAAKRFDVPLSTLRDRFFGRYPEGKHKPGPSIRLSKEQEGTLRDHLIHMARIGHGISKKDVPLLIKEILDRAEVEKPDEYCVNNRCFPNNIPSNGWVYRFFNRNPELSLRVPENLSHKRANINKDQILKWFEDLSKFLYEEHGIEAADFFTENNAHRIFNLDETGFPLAGTNGKLRVITTRGVKNVYKLVPDTKEQVSVLGCTSAAGDFAKPLVIFPGVRPRFNFHGVQPEDYYVGTSQNGWMSADCFFGWMANLFYPSICDAVEFPILVFMDGHTSHINIAISSFCRENNIILYCFPPHASHVLQPLDVAVYGPLKKHWNDSLNDFAREFKGLSMNRSHFFKVF